MISSARKFNQRGFTTLFILVFAPLALFLIMSTISLSLTSRQQAMVSRNRAEIRSMLDSLTEYTIYGIKNRWCFGDTWTKDATCSVTHNRSIDRLILSQMSRMSLEQSLGGVSVPILTEFGATVNPDVLPADHPISVAIRADHIGKDLFESLVFKVERITNRNIPSRGNEIVLRVTVEARPPASHFLLKAFSNLTSTSVVVVTPRQLAYFGLIVPQDLHLDNDGQTTADGDFGLPVNAGGNGVVFESPIYVHRRIHLPKSGQTNKTTFGQKVYIGDGSLFMDETPYIPPSPGGPGAQTYTQMGRGTIFARGIELDGDPDRGLLYFAGLNPGSTPPPAATAECRDLTNAERDLASTSRSEILVRDTSPDTGNRLVHKFELGLTGYNRFVRQQFKGRVETDYSHSNPKGQPNTNARARMRLEYDLLDGAGNPIVNTNPAVQNCTTASRCLVLDIGPSTTEKFHFNFHLGASGSGLDVGTDVQLWPVTDGGVDQPNRAELSLTFSGKVERIQAVRVTFEPYDIAFHAGRDRRYDSNGNPISGLLDANYSRKINIALAGPSAAGPALVTLGSGAARPGTTWLGSSGTGAVPVMRPFPDELIGSIAVLYGSLIDRCQAGRSSIGSSFNAAGWDNDELFDSQTREVWKFANPVASVTLPGTRFGIQSIAGICTIAPTDRVVAGFYVCDELRIPARAQPLTIMGTIIARRSVVSPAAVAAGIHWRSIYHPQSTYDLRDRNILLKSDSTACPIMPALPVWHPSLSARDLFDNYICNTISLLDKADPFSWTTMSPDCGWQGTEPNPRCMRKPRRLLVREISRDASI